MTKVKAIAENENFKILNMPEESLEADVENIYCCDLLSIAMSRMPEKAVWVTVMSNMNTLAVASLTDTACVVMAEGVNVDEAILSKAAEQGITLLQTDLPIYEAAIAIRGLMI